MPTRLQPFRLLRSKDQQFYFNVVAANGEVVATSEMYTQKESALAGLVALQAICVETSGELVNSIDDRTKHE